MVGGKAKNTEAGLRGLRPTLGERNKTRMKRKRTIDSETGLFQGSERDGGILF